MITSKIHTYIIPITLLICISLLQSCGNEVEQKNEEYITEKHSPWLDNEKENKNIEEKWNKKSELDFVYNIPNIFVENEHFISCTKSSIDSCMLDAVQHIDTIDTITCDQFLLAYNRESCELNNALQEAKTIESTEPCFKLSDNQRLVCEEEIKMQLSIESGDISHCDNIDEYENKAICVNTITLKIAEKNRDVNYCDNMQGVVPEWDKNLEIEYCKESVQYIIDNFPVDDESLIDQEIQLSE